MQDYASSRSAVLIEGLVTADPFRGAYEGHIAVYPAERFASLARNPAIVWAVARGDHDEDEIPRSRRLPLVDPALGAAAWLGKRPFSGVAARAPPDLPYCPDRGRCAPAGILQESYPAQSIQRFAWPAAPPIRG